MTDVLDRSAAPGHEPEPAAEAQLLASSAQQPPPGPATRPEHWFLAALLLGAGLIHAAMAPSHLGEAAVEGAGFVASAWVQLLLAVAVLLRPTRRALVVVVVTSAALIVAWVVSRTAGLPFGGHAGHAESVSIVDGVCVALEAVALLLAGVLALGIMPTVPRIRGLAIAGAIGAVAFATAAISSPAARDHAAGSHGVHGHDGMAAGHDDSAAAGHGHGATEGDDLGFSALSNGHQHERGVEAMNTEDTVALAKQLAVTAELVEKYPTIAAAEAAGWKRAGPFSPGLGTHYGAPDYHLNPDGKMDTRDDLLSPMLVFDGVGPDAKLAGFMYLAYGTEAEPEGFAGPNDHWHFHEKVCIVRNPEGGIDTPLGADLDGVTEQMCTDVGGSFIEFTGYMVHVWNVPGYESPNGMFTELNPAITCPDGTYHRIPIEELGTKNTVCKSA